MVKRLISILLLFLFVFGTASCGQDVDTNGETTDPPALTEEPFIITEDTLVLVQNNISSYTIICPEGSTEANVKAATELQSYIKKISGVELPIKTDAEPSVELEIAVGYTNRSAEGQFDREKLGDEGFVIETVGKKLFIAGSGVRGALYGVYTFLEKYLGCRFYTSDFEKVPTRDTLGVQPIERDEQIPVFEYRDIDFVTSRQNNFQPKLKANGVYNNSPAEYGGKIEYVGGFAHTFETILPHDKYFEAHPEYFGLNEDGTRQTGWGAQPCLSNPEVLEITKEWVRGLLKDRPDAKIISITQPDNSAAQKPCMCESCQKIYAEEGAYSGALIRFVNAVAAEFAADYPELKFDTFAYHHTRSVCKTAPADNVVIRLCTIECCFSHPLGTCPDVYAMAGSTKTISEDIADWGKICDNIYIWDYTTNYVESVAFFPNFNVLLQNAKFFADNNAVGVYEEGNYYSETCDFPELRSYIMAKVLWDPYMSKEEYWGYIDEFLRDYYGEGWTYIREYIDMAQKYVSDKHFGIHDKFAKTIFAHKVEKVRRELPEELTLDMIKNYESTDWEKYLDYGNNVVECEVVVRGAELFDAAAALATPDEAERIAKLRMIPEFAHSYALKELYSIKAIKDNITNLLSDFFAQSEEGKSVPTAEKTELIFAVREQVVNTYRDAYEKYNRELFGRAMKYEINKISEAMPYFTLTDDIDFNVVPGEWKKK